MGYELNNDKINQLMAFYEKYKDDYKIKILILGIGCEVNSPNLLIDNDLGKLNCTLDEVANAVQRHLKNVEIDRRGDNFSSVVLVGLK